jgi:hypothetical protein
MPINLTKTYNELLDIIGMDESSRKKSLMLIFDRDIRNNPELCYLNKPIHPTPVDGELKIEILFSHLTTVMIDHDTKHRAYDFERASRLHWVKFHLDVKKQDRVLHFSVKEPEGLRTYIYDMDEKYVIVLEPLRKISAYYLLTAYYLIGKDAKRNKMMNKYKRREKEVY